MGPFPHDAPPAKISDANPAGTDGFEFVEFAHPEPEKLAELFDAHGLPAGRPASHEEHHRLAPGRHQLHPQRRAAARMPCDFVEKHGPCAPSMAWRVVDAQHAFEHAVSKGADAL